MGPMKPLIINNDHLTRQMEILPLESLHVPIFVIGAGAIGSFVVLSLTKMGFEDITVFDFDEVSVENMNCQWYRFRDIGLPKVKALQALIWDFTNVMIKPRQTRFRENNGLELKGIVISAVDSMEARKVIWNEVKSNFRVSWFIDPRMAAEYALSYVMNPNDPKDITAYENTLYTDENAVQERCTAKATMYTATMIAGYVAKHVKDVVTGGEYARVTHWNIGTNVMQNWAKKQGEL